MKPAERAYRAANDFRKARREFEAQFGRPPNRRELDGLAQGLREAVARTRS